MSRVGLAVGGAIVGGVIASFIPGASILLGAQLGFLGGSLAGAFLFPPELPTQFGPRVQDTQVTTSAYGRPIPIVYGRMRVGGNLVWAKPLREVRHEEEVDAKGGASQTVVSFSYFGTGAFVLCEGEARILKIWADTDLVYTRIGTGAQTPEKYVGTLRFYEGTLTQQPDPVIEADLGIDNAYALRGVCYFVFDDFPLEDFGNRIPQFTALVASSSTQAFNHTTWSHFGNGTTTSGFMTSDRRYLYVNGVGKGDVATQTAIFSGRTYVDALGNSSILVGGVDSLDRLIIIYHTGSGGRFSHFGVFEDTGENIITSTPFDCLTNITVLADHVVTTGLPAGSTRPLSQLYVMRCGLADTLVCVKTGFVTDSEGDVQERIIAEVELPVETTFAPWITSVTLNVSFYDDHGVAFDNSGNLWVQVGHEESGNDKMFLGRINAETLAIEEVVDVTSAYGGNNIRFDSRMNYLADNNSLYWQGANEVLWYDINSGQSGRIPASVAAAERNWATFLTPPYDGRIYVAPNQVAGINLVEVDLINRVVGETVTPAVAPWDVEPEDDYWGAFWDHANGALVISGPGIFHTLFFDRYDGNNLTDQNIVEDISTRVGFTGSEIDATALTKTRHGYLVDRTMEARAAIVPLAQVGLWDGYESDFKVKFKNRGGSSIATIPEEDIGVYPVTSNPSHKLVEEYVDPLELPLEVLVQHINHQMDYQSGSAPFTRSTEAVATRRRQVVNVVLAMTPQEARQIAQEIMNDHWIRKKTYSTSVTWEHIIYDPTDVITLEHNGQTFDLMLTSMSYGDDGVLKLEGISNSIPLLTSTIGGQDIDGFDPSKVILLGLPTYSLIDGPLLRDIDPDFNLYISCNVSGSETDWPGATVNMSLDGGSTFSLRLVAVPGTRGTTIGFATTALPAPTSDFYYWDEDNTFNVNIITGDVLSSTTKEDVLLNQTNALIMRSGTKWEYLHFVNATLVSGTTYTLSTLLRGRRNTEEAVGTHQIGDVCVFPTPSTLFSTAMSQSEFGVTRQYRAATIGSADGVVRGLNYKARSYMPYSPYNPTGAPSGTDWIVNWYRRTRKGGLWRNIAWPGLPLAQSVQDYEVDILDPIDDSIVRTITSTASSGGSVVAPLIDQFTYTDADQTTDFGSVRSLIKFNLYQKDVLVGRSPVVTKEIGTQGTSAAPIYVDSTQISSLNTNSLNATVPTNQDGDLLIAFQTQRASVGQTFSVSGGGWTQLLQTQGSTFGGHYAVWYRIASSEPGTYTFQSTHSGDDMAIIIMSISNVDGANPIIDSSVTDDGGNNWGPLTITSIPALLVAPGVCERGFFTFAPPTGFTTDETGAVGGTGGISFGIGHQTWLTLGSTGILTGPNWGVAEVNILIAVKGA